MKGLVGRGAAGKPLHRLGAFAGASGPCAPAVARAADEGGVPARGRAALLPVIPVLEGLLEEHEVRVDGSQVVQPATQGLHLGADLGGDLVMVRAVVGLPVRPLQEGDSEPDGSVAADDLLPALGMR